MKPVDFASALAEARRVLEKRQPVPMTWLLGFFHLEDARDALGRPLTDLETAEFCAVAAALWQATADACIAELEEALAIGPKARNEVKGLLDGALVSVRQAAPSAGKDWDEFARPYREMLDRARDLLDRHSRPG